MQADIMREFMSTLDSCNEHLKDCHSLCLRMGTPQWTADSNSRLTMSWNFFFTYLSKAAILLQLELLDAQPTDATPSPIPTPQSSTPKLSLARRDSFLSNGGSENFTIEGRVGRRERAERQRRKDTQQNPLLVTTTGNKLRKPNTRAPSIIMGFSDSSSTVSSFSDRASVTVSPSLPRITEEKTPAMSILSIPRTLPPEYSKDTRDAKTLISTTKDDAHYNFPMTTSSPPSVLPVESEPQMTEASFAPYGHPPSNHMVPSGWQTPMPMPPPTPIQRPMVPVPHLPPSRVAAYKPSRSSLRESVALHLSPFPAFSVDLIKPSARCAHGIRHFKGHSSCQWGCCSSRGCGQSYY
ncbi:unnamed protein product [Fusarium venenatum]|uniref:Uncharacterized protein n=1 Tax=Fusarium venenatum TaxID=56646 RepID=A0A2L2U3G1_9HYPO|nr:uncharacterized protein FVRRES_10557 [Fusarium venenatum]CEI70480.1 unnamed protein product [Fusarium venenatum]